MTSFLCKLGTKNNFLEVLPIFFRTIGLQHKLLILIENLNRFLWKSTKKESGCGLLGKILAKLGPML